MSEQQKEEKSVEQQLLDVFNQSFTREALEKNPYYVYKLTSSLQLQLEDIYNEKSVKAISTQKDEILKTLKECKLIKVLEDQTNVVIDLQSKENVLIAKIADDLASQEQFTNFIQEQLDAKQLRQQAESENNSVKIKFQEKSDALDFSQHLLGTTYQNKKIEVEIKPENIQTNLMKSVKEYQNKKRGGYNGQSAVENPEMNTPVDPQQQALYYQQQYQQAYYQQQLLLQQQAMFQSPNFTHIYSPQDYSDFYIRKSRNDDKKKKQQYTPQELQQIAYMQQYAAAAYYNNYPQQQYQQDNKGKKGVEKTNKKDGEKKKEKKETTTSNKDQQNKERTNVHQRKDHSNNKKRKDSRSEKNDNKKVTGSKSVNKNRPRIDSDNFPVLHEVDEKGKKQTVQYLQKAQKPTASPALVPYVETRTKIDKQYSKFEILTSFERWKVSKEINTKLKSYLGNKKIPVIREHSPITKLEVEQPYRKNSSSVTPLLKPMPAIMYRKGSAQHFHNPSASPNPHKKYHRKLSSQK